MRGPMFASNATFLQQNGGESNSYFSSGDLDACQHLLARRGVPVELTSMMKWLSSKLP